jgi:two-component SAPR family response regulator
MNLFRSEEHIRNWAQFSEGTEDGILSLNDLLKLFSGRYFRKRLDPDWVTNRREYVRDMLTTLTEIGKTGPFWRRPKPAQKDAS